MKITGNNHDREYWTALSPFPFYNTLIIKMPYLIFYTLGSDFSLSYKV